MKAYQSAVRIVTGQSTLEDELLSKDFGSQKGDLSQLSNQPESNFNQPGEPINQDSMIAENTQKTQNQGEESKMQEEGQDLPDKQVTAEVPAKTPVADQGTTNRNLLVFQAPKARLVGKKKPLMKEGDLRFYPIEHQSIDIPNRREPRSRSRSRRKLDRRRRRTRFRTSLISEMSQQDSSASSYLSNRSEVDSFDSGSNPRKTAGVDLRRRCKEARKGSNSSGSLIHYFDYLVDKLSEIRDSKRSGQASGVSKEVTYAEMLKLISNCEKVDLDFDLLIGGKLGKYLHLAYTILLEINDFSSIGYQRLLPKLSKMQEVCKSKILSIFSGNAENEKKEQNYLKLKQMSGNQDHIEAAEQLGVGLSNENQSTADKRAGNPRAALNDEGADNMSLSTTQDKISFLMSGVELPEDQDPKPVNTAEIFSTSNPNHSRADDMVSLIDEEHRADRCYSLRNERTLQHSRSLSVTKNSRSSKKHYAKEQHFLKLLYMERLSERSSSMSYTNKNKKSSLKASKSKLIFMLRNSAQKMYQRKTDSVKKDSNENYASLGTFGVEGAKFKIQHSSKSRTSSSSLMSSLENFDSNRPRSHHQDLNAAINELIKVKVEEGREMTKKRKKICRKIFEIFSKEKHLEKSFSQKLSLYIESKINRMHPHSTKEYLSIIKQLFNKIRRNEITVDDIKQMLRKKRKPHKSSTHEGAHLSGLSNNNCYRRSGDRFVQFLTQNGITVY